MPKLKRAAAALLLSALLVPSAAARDLPVSAIGDDSALRSELAETLFVAPPAEALAFKRRVRTLPDGSRVEVRVEKGNGEFITVLAREADGAFPVATQGSWALYRRTADGAPTRIRVFLRSDPHCYAQVRLSESGRAILDAVAYGGYLARGIPLSIPFGRVVSEPLGRLLSATAPLFPVRYFQPDPADYADLAALGAAIRANLGGLTYVDDGAFDEAGRSVFIATGAPLPVPGGVNCSGFAKWVADGLLRAIGKPPLPIPPLKIPPEPRGTVSAEPYESILDPYFGLDWTRNLAVALGSAYRGGGPRPVSEYEVRRSPIAALRIPGGDGSLSRTFPDFLPDAGFQMEGLKPILYALAIDEPGRMYFGSINRDMSEPPYARRHFHIALFLPRFDAEGRFVVDVFESGTESGMDAFVARYPGHSISLVRVAAEAAFQP